MYVKIDKLNENHGWSIRVDQEVLGCNDCNKPLSKIPYKQGKEFYWCEQSNKFLCRSCMLSHRLIKEHIDWNIVEIKVNNPIITVLMLFALMFIKLIKMFTSFPSAVS